MKRQKVAHQLLSNLRWGVRRTLSASIGFAVVGAIPFMILANKFESRWGVGPLRPLLGYLASVILIGLIIGAARPVLHGRIGAMLVGVLCTWTLMMSVAVSVTWGRPEVSIWLVAAISALVSPIAGAMLGIKLWRGMREDSGPAS